ncbi:MAG: hypothetical protein BWK73_11830 [Thiothrix lacustris]|uniref:DUF11 domain-containing protein n=1 Tax=Thiothrix lacustris TaxID=525917 RepID=A0A1Y1QTM2_9GAMM|nr:MAG: hypothetical protein BWK73_11830 [Thiothrix lacustris]
MLALLLGGQPVFAAGSDLLISKQVSTVTPQAGETFTYTLRYRCASITELYCATPTLTDIVPAPLKIVAYTPLGGNVAAAAVVDKTVTWRLATPVDSLPEGVPADGLAAGSTGILKVQVKFPTCGSAAPPAVVSNVASAASGGVISTSIAPDVSVPVGIDAPCPTPPPAPSPGFTKTGSADFVQPGGLERWSVSLPTSETAYTVVETLPAGTQVERATASNTPAVMNYPEVDCSVTGAGAFHPLNLSVSAWAAAETAAGRAGDLHDAAGNSTGCVATRLPSGMLVTSIKRLRWGVSAAIAKQTLDVRLVVDADYVGDGLRNCVESSLHGTSCAPLVPVVGQGEPILSLSKIAPTGGLVSPDGSTVVYNVLAWQPVVAPAPASNDYVYRVSLAVDELSGTGTQYPILEDVLPASLDYVTGQAGNWWRVAVPSNGVTTEQTACQIPRFSRTVQADGRVKLRWEFPGCQLPVGLSDKGMAVYFSTRIRPGIAAGTAVINMAQFSTGDYPQVTCVNGADGGKTARAFCRSSNVSFNVPQLTTLDSVKWVQGELDSTLSRFPSTGKTGSVGVGTYVLEIRNTGNVTNTQVDVRDVLPVVGDSALVTGGARGSQWSVVLAGEIGLQRVTSEGAVTTLTATEVPAGVEYAANNAEFQLTVLPSGGLQPGEKLRVTVPVRQLAGEATPVSGSIAWNSFAYTASYYDTATKTTETLLTTEPPKVGLMMVDTATVAGLSGAVWLDNNGDGQKTADEVATEGVTVRVYDGATLVAEAVTDVAGHYAIWGLLPDTVYRIALDKPDDYMAGNPLAGVPPQSIAEAKTGAAGRVTADYDVGITLPASVGDRVWLDVNGDGVQDADESGVAGVTVVLHSADGVSLASTQTNAAGMYGFEDVLPGDYYLVFSEFPAGYVPTASGMSGNAQTDSDANAAGKTPVFALVAGAHLGSWDLGLTVPRQTDLSLRKSMDKSQVKRGEALVYTLVISNTGGHDANGVQVRDVLPAGLVFQSASPLGEYDALTGVWQVGWLAAQHNRQLQITAQAR